MATTPTGRTPAVQLHLSALATERSARWVYGATVAMAVAIPLLVGVFASPGATPTVVSALVASGQHDGFNRVYAAVYVAFPLVAGLGATYFGVRLSAIARERGVFASLRTDPEAERRVMLARLTAGMIAAAGLWATFAVSVVAISVTEWGSGARDLFNGAEITNSQAVSMLTNGLVLLGLHVLVTYLLAFLIGRVASVGLATAVPAGIYLAGLFLRGVPLIDAILRNAPSYYMETWLSPVSAGSVMNDVTHGIVIAVGWAVVAGVLILVVPSRPPRLGEIG